MNLLLLGLFLNFCIFAFNAEVYVDCDNGLDSQTGSSLEPIKTINQLNSMINGGDFVYLKNGCKFSTGIVVDHLDNVAITSYGSGDLPVIDFSELISSSWTSIGNSVYYTTVSVGDVEHVFVDGKSYNMSHYPSNPMENYFIIRNGQSSSSNIIQVNQEFIDAVSGQDVSNIEFVIRSRRWAFDKAIIESIDTSGLTITLDAQGSYSPYNDDSGFFIMNKLWMLEHNQDGAYFFDTSNNRLYVRISEFENDQNPANHEIRYLESQSSNNYGIHFDNSNGCSVSNIRIQNTIQYGIYSQNSDSLDASSLEIINSGQVAIRFSGSDLKFDANVIDGAGYSAYRGEFHNRGEITNNEITNVFANGPLNYQFSGTEIIGRGMKIDCQSSSDQDFCYITGNRLENIGYNGIAMGGHRFVVRNNLIKHVCFISDDGAGVYWWGNDEGATGNIEVSNNMILDSVGNNFGTEAGWAAAQGIYADDRTDNNLITDNVVINSWAGIQLHNSRAATIERNLIFGSKRSAIYLNGNWNLGFLTDHVVKNNVFHAIPDKTTLNAKRESGWDNIFDELEDNYYHETNLALGDQYSTISGWQGYVTSMGYTWSRNAKKIGGTSYVEEGNEDDDFTVIKNEDLTNPKTITLQNKYCDIDGNIITETKITLQPLKAMLLVNCFCNNDGTCNNEETAATCPNDCPPEGECGNGECGLGWNSKSCPQDCNPVCGNFICEDGFNANNCPSDCSPICGNGICEEDETHENCPSDCSEEINPESNTTSTCGNGICGEGLNYFNCPEDCLNVGLTIIFVSTPILIISFILILIVVIVLILFIVLKNKTKKSSETPVQM